MSTHDSCSSTTVVALNGNIRRLAQRWDVRYVSVGQVNIPRDPVRTPMACRPGSHRLLR
ncbi:hypothetical protein BD414DRAFT_500436 [Trametes punicea]|nr:hypothetical protein BD414DRAFT_500436 [Trametes punicea]